VTILLGNRLYISSDRHAWVQVARGAVMLNGMSLKAGDGAAVSEEEKLKSVRTIPRKYCCSIWVDITALVALDEIPMPSFKWA